MASIDKINEESKLFAKQWRLLLLRQFIAIVLGAILLIGLSPTTPIGILATFLFAAPIFFWASKWPEKVKVRAGVSVLLIITSTILYIGARIGS